MCDSIHLDLVLTASQCKGSDNTASILPYSDSAPSGCACPSAADGKRQQLTARTACLGNVSLRPLSFDLRSLFADYCLSGCLTLMVALWGFRVIRCKSTVPEHSSYSDAACKDESATAGLVAGWNRVARSGFAWHSSARMLLEMLGFPIMAL